MRVEAIFLLAVAVFFGCVGAAYWFLSYEQGGTMMLVGTCLLGLLPGGYYFYWYRRMIGYKYFFWGKMDKAPGVRLEDREDATIEDGAGIIDSFPGSSIWPFILGMGAFMLVLGLVFGVWIAFPGVALILTALVGVTAESRRGGHV